MFKYVIAALKIFITNSKYIQYTKLHLNFSHCSEIHFLELDIRNNPEPGLERFLIKKICFQAGPLFHL